VIPAWLLCGNAAPVATPVRAGGRLSFLERTLGNAAALAGEVFFSDTPARRSGLLQRLDPRCLLLAFLALIVTVSLARSPRTVWGIYLCTLAPAFLSGGFNRPFIRRMWLVVPVFAALLALPSLCNLIIPGEAAWVVARLGQSREIGPWHIPAEITVTRQGLHFAALFVGRVAASAALAALLALTIPWSRLLQALRLFRVPPLLILTLAMTYRYIALLALTVTELHTARRSRTVRYGNVGAEQRWVAARLGFLFGKSYRLSLAVHDAMISRGFAGDVKASAAPRLQGKDFAAFFLVMLFCAGAVLLERIN
jgi:cobalt/nickel transport system permease protein